MSQDIVGDAIHAITEQASGRSAAVAGTTAVASATINSIFTSMIPSPSTILDAIAQSTKTAATQTLDAVAEAEHQVASAPIPTGTDFTWTFIHAHENYPSSPNYRYAYIFWIVMAVILTTYAVSHHLRLSGGVIGAYFNRWGMRRHTVRYGSKKSGRSFILPSNSYLLTMSIVAFTALMLSLVGPDHIADSTGVWGRAAGYKRAYDTMMDEIYATELIRPKHSDTINKAWWTSGNRFGSMAFAMMPLIVALALKSGPFGFLTPKWFTALHWDKVGTYHRAGGWFVWWLVTIHVVLWTVQLFSVHYDDGRPMWVMMLIATRFRCAIASYFFMTAAMVLSIRWVRDRMYEVFYLSHCVFILCSFVFAIVHHHVIGYWIGACLVLWAGDRATRFSRSGYINGVFGSNKKALPSNPFHDKYEAEANMPIVEIPAGYAQAQILPSKTVRLSIRTHRPMKWAPGQSLLLTIPELSRFQTHPFSIANNDPNEIVLLIKARKGLTLDLYNLVLERTRKALKPSDKRLSILPKSAPVHIKSYVDGPMGSAGRVPWLDFSNVLIVCGGSGVTFGLAVCDYLSTVMNEPGYSGATRRVRFVWIVREYAEITWAASALCRFRSALDRLKLEINIYVTNGEKSKSVDRQRKTAGDDSDEEIDPTISRTSTSLSEIAHHEEGEIDPETGLSYDESDIRGLTNFGDEEDNSDAKDRRLSKLFQEEGKLRRMISRQSALYDRRQSIASSVGRFNINSYYGTAGDRNTAYGESLHVPSMYGEPMPSMPAPAMPPNAARRVSELKYQNQLRRYSNALSNITGSSIAEHEAEHEVRRVSRSPLATHLEREDSQATLASSNLYDDDDKKDPFSDPMHYKAFTSRTQDMVLLENTPDAMQGAPSCMSCGHCVGESLWIDEGDYMATKLMSENARTGRPPLQTILNEEMRAAEGQTIIATCGPVGLNTALRNLVSSSIDTAKIRSGDPSGYVTMYSEDFEM